MKTKMCGSTIRKKFDITSLGFGLGLLSFTVFAPFTAIADKSNAVDRSMIAAPIKAITASSSPIVENKPAVVNKLVLAVPYYDFGKFKDVERRRRTGTFASTEAILNSGSPIVAEIEFRGQSCLKATRPCMDLKLAAPISFGKDANSGLHGKHFNLVSMWQDIGYISSNIGYRLEKAANVAKLKTEYIEVIVKGSQGQSESLGLYLITERPAKAAKSTQKAEFVGRRRYKGGFETKEYNEKKAVASEAAYQQAFQDLYAAIASQSGEQLWETLKAKIDIEAYMRWLALNYLVRNGDYSDEVFFSGALVNNQVYFRPFPWDFDDLFKPMHSVPFLSKDPAKYPGSRLYNYEDPLDLKIASDKFLYDQYERVQAELLTNLLTDEQIDRTLNQIKTEISPYLDIPEVLSNSKDDDGPAKLKAGTYSKESILALIEQRRLELKQRRAETLKEKASLK